MAESMGKGAWDCDKNVLIPPEKEAEVFEEIATMAHSFEGIPSVPPRKDMTHLTFFCSGCRYRVTASPSDLVKVVKERLIAGGIGRSNKGFTPGIHEVKDLVLIYAGQHMDDDEAALEHYHVPPGCQCMIAIDAAKIKRRTPDADSPYWN
jgi:hypothetical protein